MGGRRGGRNDPSGKTRCACCQMDNLSFVECTLFYSRANGMCVVFYKELESHCLARVLQNGQDKIRQEQLLTFLSVGLTTVPF